MRGKLVNGTGGDVVQPLRYAAASRQRPRREAATNVQRPTFTGMKPSTVPYALVVDDNPIVRMDACQILQTAGFRCLEAETGDEAKSLLKRWAPSITLVFTDVDMPGDTDGFALARFVAENWPDVDIVVASGRVRPKDDELPGTATFIGKPFDSSIVIQHLKQKLPDGRKPEPLRTMA